MNIKFDTHGRQLGACVEQEACPVLPARPTPRHTSHARPRALLTLLTGCSLLAGIVTESASPERTSTAFRNSNERLYEAYNDLHSLAQDFEKPFDAPAILVIGHQTDGKSGTCILTSGSRYCSRYVPVWRCPPFSACVGAMLLLSLMSVLPQRRVSEHKPCSCVLSPW